MQYLGIEYNMKHTPKLDQQFVPFGVWRAAYLKDAKKPIAIAVERDKGRVSVHHTCIHGTPEMAEADYRYVERYVKFLLWSVGGFRVSVCGCSELAQRLKKAYDPKGERHFDFTFFNQLYECDLEIVDLPLDACPAANEVAEPIGGNLDGCRIGFDAGGSDRKVSAVIDGECVYSEEVVWFPKLQADPQYHYDGIVAAFKSAASRMPRVDAIGVSSAGTFIGNAPMVASLFIKVPRSKWEQVKTIYDRAAKEIVGCKYFSQDAVIKLAPAAGIALDENLSPAEKLKVVQALMEKDDPGAQAIFETIGAYLAYTVVLYSQFYDIEHMMMLGRVMSGKGGDTILRVCNEILADEYPALAKKCEVSLPDEKTRRVGQSVAAASLPRIR